MPSKLEARSSLAQSKAVFLRQNHAADLWQHHFQGGVISILHCRVAGNIRPIAHTHVAAVSLMSVKLGKSPSELVACKLCDPFPCLPSNEGVVCPLRDFPNQKYRVRQRD